MEKTGMKAVVSLFKKGYSFAELLVIYSDAKAKKMSDDMITESYLLSEIIRIETINNNTIDRATYKIYYDKRYDFLSPTLGVVYPMSKIYDDGKVSVLTSDRKIKKVDYQTLTPILEESKIHREMFESVLPKYYSKTGLISKENIYDILRICGEDLKLLNKLGIYLSTLYDSKTLNPKDTEYVLNKFMNLKDKVQEKSKNIKDELKEKYNSLKHDINEKENFKELKNYFEMNFGNTIRKEPKYISRDGSLSEEEVEILVRKLNEDLSLLELIGIIPNPNYIDPNTNSNGHKK